MSNDVDTPTDANDETESNGDDNDDAIPERRNAADRLIDYALHDPTQTLLFVDQHGQLHALVNEQPLPLTSRCHKWLRRLMWEKEERTVSSDALARATGTLAAMAEASGEQRELHVRSAWHNDTLYVELKAGEVLRVDTNGWQIDQAPPVLFRCYTNLKPLPIPEPGGSLDTILKLFNLRSERHRRLLVAYITCGLLPHVSRPILQTTGAMGSGKTTLHRIVKRLLDPTTPETLRLDPRDTLQKVSHCAVVLCDNLSNLANWQVDTLCRLVTGEGDSKRQLYTDDDDIIYEIRRLVLLNSINPPADRPDFLDRCLCLELERIPDDKREDDEVFDMVFEREHARWLGCLFDLLSTAMQIKDRLQLAWKPRLASWGKWAAAVYEAAGWGADTFLADWRGNVESQQSAVLEGSTLAQVLLKFAEGLQADDEGILWAGIPTDLLNGLQGVAKNANIDTKGDKTFPKAANALTRRLRELLPLLTAHGVDVKLPDRQRDKSDASIKRILTIQKVGAKTVNIVNTDNTTSETPENEGFSDFDSVDDTSPVDAMTVNAHAVSSTEQPQENRGFSGLVDHVNDVDDTLATSLDDREVFEI